METLSVESFSYGWLVNQNPPIDTCNSSFRALFDPSDEYDASFIEMDPNLSPSKRFLGCSDFDFDVPTFQSFVDADKLISNGILLPVNSYRHSIDTPANFIPVSPLSSPAQEDPGLYRKSRSLSLRRCNRLPKRIIQKYMDFVRPIWCRIKRKGSDSSRVQGVDKWECSSGSASRGSEAGWVDNRRRSCDSESSIHEAVVHCKKTIGMS